MIRKATNNDIPKIMEIIAAAKAYMRKTGNMTQWAGNYPSPELIEKDILEGNEYVIERADGKGIFACFGIFPGDDPTYAYIEGSWASDAPYAAIHRVASDGSEGGVVKRAVEFAKGKHSHLRIDTHADNKPMQKAVTDAGFEYRGIIYLEDGAPRMAYELVDYR